MKAKKNETPTSSWLVLLLLIALVLWTGSDHITASEVNVVNNTLTIVDTPNLAKNTKTTMEIEDEIAAGAVIKKQAQQELEKQRRQALEEQKQQEAQRQAAIAAEEARYSSVGVCGYLSSKKTYMDYRAINSYSTQMYIINTSTTVHDDGLLRTEDGFVAVALGSTYGALGSKYRITTDTGQVFKVIKVDEKSDMHTTNGCQDASGAIIEFVIDIHRVGASYPQVTLSGDFNSLLEFSGNIVNVEKYN